MEEESEAALEYYCEHDEEEAEYCEEDGAAKVGTSAANRQNRR